MGVWGYKSYNCDIVLDAVNDSELGKVENEDLYQAIGQCTVGYFGCFGKDKKCDEDLSKHKRCSLGVVMYAIDHVEFDNELKDLNKEIFGMAKHYAEDLLSDKEYISAFRSPTKKRNALKKEIKKLDNLLNSIYD